MKKLRLLTVALTALMYSSVAFAGQVITYIVNQNFTDAIAHPTGWSSATETNYSMFSSGGTNYTVVPNQLNFAGTTSSKAGGVRVKFPNSGTNQVVNVEFDWSIKTLTVGAKNAFALFLQDDVAASYTTAGDILMLYLTGSDAKVHCQNIKLDLISPYYAVGCLNGINGSTNTAGRFITAGVTAAATIDTCNILNAPTQTECTWAQGQTIHVKAILDFTTHKVTYLHLLNTTDGSFYENTTGLDFITATASNVGRISATRTYNTNGAGNGTATSFSVGLDNFQTYTVAELPSSDVTINYVDELNNPLKSARVEPSLVIGSIYHATVDDKVKIVTADYYYTYDATSTVDSIAVAEGGSVINLRFKKYAITKGTYTWKGTANKLWSEEDANFSTDDVNQLPYQTGNAVKFINVSAPNKDIILNSKLQLDSANMTIDAEGYSIVGSGKLSGTGTIDVNASTKLGFINAMSGNLNLNSGTLEISNIQVASKYIIKDGTTLKVDSGITSFNKPIAGAGTFTVIPTAQVDYTGAITGVSQINYNLQVIGNPAAMSKMPKLNFTLDPLTKVNVTTTRTDTTYFGTTANFTKMNVHPGDYVYMVYSANPATGNATVINIGELTGGETTKLVGCNVRSMTYSVGGLNTDATYAGTLAPRTKDAWGYRADFNINKVGKGTWTLTGNSPNFFGGVKVLDGTLKVDGTLCSGVGEYVFGATTFTTVSNKIPEVLVADTATLAGSGFIGANVVTVNGTITGNLNIGGSVSLKPDLGAGGATTIINASADGVDKIKIAGDLNYGGKLIVKANGPRPAVGDYTIFEAANYIESGLFGFDSIELPSANWLFNFSTGVLTYKGGDELAVPVINSSKEITTIEYYDSTGKQISKYQKGFVFMKVKYTDGTSMTYKTYKTK